jgi:hypothetical protein
MQVERLTTRLAWSQNGVKPSSLVTPLEMNENEIARLQAYLQQWIRNNPTWHQRAAEDIAAELARDADFSTIRLAGWLRTPDGTLTTQIVQSVLPYPYSYGAKVLADAIQIAARQRTRSERLQALGAGTVVALVVILGLRR